MRCAARPLPPTPPATRNAGCFDTEDEAARAYDKMMLWAELHNAAGVKSGITNFDISHYDAEVAWLKRITQVGHWAGWAGQACRRSGGLSRARAAGGALGWRGR